MNPDPNRKLLSLLQDVARLTRAEADKRARVHGMTRAQWGLMSRLSRYPGLSQKELADMLEVEPISVARMVDRLEANGLLERRADASDRRIWRLHLLPAAEPMLKKMAALAEELGAFVVRDVPHAMQAAMVEGLLRMKANLGHRADPPAAAAAGSLKTDSTSARSRSAITGQAEPGPFREIA